MKVIIVAPGPASEGGIRSVVASIMPRLDAFDDVDVTWIASHSTGSAFAKIWCFVSALFRSLIHVPRSKILHVHGTVGTSLLRKSVFIWLASLFRCRSIFHFHATQHVFDDYFSDVGWRRRYSVATLRRCTAIAVLSESWVDIVRPVLPDSNIVVVYNPVLDPDGASSGEDRDSNTVLYLAHLIERKGYLDLINALPDVISKVPDVRLVFCGSGELERAKSTCQALGILDHVEFPGWVEDAEKQAWLSAATLFCLPSYDEGLPMGILESMSSGLPVVATPVGGIPDVLTHDENALLFEPGDIAGLSAQLVRLLTAPDLRERLAAQAMADSQRFRPSRIAHAWVDLYRRIST